MKTNDLKKGTRIKLADSGWEATLIDSKKGNIRYADVEGVYREMGSIYSHDIVAYQTKDGAWHTDIEYTPAQLACRQANDSIFGDEDDDILGA